ncbi:pentapeptide repeat-containing protein [Bradyrhizobium yuanmingense]|nr:pentapeptide repeat-containing protein [Bradyrhizobium yuanmingense]
MNDQAQPLDLTSVERALNEASSKINALWISFCLLLAYYAISIGSVTHRQLFFNSPIQLPALSVNLPLVGFFIVSPILLLLFHVYVLAQYAALFRKALLFNKAIVTCVRIASDRRLFWRRTDSSMQLFAFTSLKGECEHGDRTIIAVSRTAMLVTIVIAPSLLLVLTHLVFLPYQSEWVSWVHRGTIVLDLLLVMSLWPAQCVELSSANEPDGYWLPRWPFALVAFLVSMFSIGVAVSPAEAIYFATKNKLTEDIFERSQRTHSDVAWHVFSNRLLLQNEVLIDKSKLSQTENTVSVNGRNFLYIQLRGADLRRADFRGSDLSHADFSYARLSDANFSCIGGASADFESVLRATVQSQSPKAGCTRLQFADFAYAQMQGATFAGSIADGATFRIGNLTGARFAAATLNFADFTFAQLTAAFFEKVEAKGATFSGAELHGARLGYSDFRGSELSANFNGAILYALDAQVADFRKANFSLATVGVSEMANTVFGNTFMNKTSVKALRFAPLKDDDVKTIDAVLQKAAGVDDESRSKRRRQNNVGQLNQESFAFWTAGERQSYGEPRYNADLLQFLVELACRSKESPYVARALVHHRFSYPNDPARADRAALSALLRNEKCAGAKELSSDDWRALENPLGG